jgi:hypothetical protein
MTRAEPTIVNTLPGAGIAATKNCQPKPHNKQPARISARISGAYDSMSKSFNSQSFILTANTPKLLAPQNLARQGMLLEVNGSNPATFKFQTTPASAIDGFTLDPASAAGGQGGSLELLGPDCPIDSIWAISAAGTTVTLHEMTSYA